MVASKVACPHCQSTLRSNRPLPVGVQVQCPKCRANFRVPGTPAPVPVAMPAPDVGIQVGARTATATATATATVAESATAATAVQTPPPMAAVPAASSATPGSDASRNSAIDIARPSSANRAWIFVLGGGALVLLLTTVLLVICFSGDKKPQEPGVGGAPVTELPQPEFKPPPPQPLIALAKREEERVTELVSRGVSYLKKTQDPNTGTWPGGHPVEYAGMAGLTLLECGVDAKDPVVQKAAGFVRRQAKTLAGTYGLSLYILFLDKLNDPQDKELIKELGMRLVAGQSAAGGWTYLNKVLSPEQTDLGVEMLREIGTRPFADFMREQPQRAKKYAPLQRMGFGVLQRREGQPNEFFRHGGDNSNTQFALLALWAARRHGLPLDRSLNLVVQRFRHCQNSDGSWNYAGTGNASPLPTMTCAGLLALAVGYGVNDAKDGPAGGPQQDEAIQKALQHLSRSIGTRPPEGGATPMTQMYFLWSVERVAVLYQLRTIGDKEWYHWGLSMLSGHQRADGSWHGGNGHGSSPLVDTCFGLLFLQRVNLAQDLTDKLRELTQAGPTQPAALGTKQ